MQLCGALSSPAHPVPLRRQWTCQCPRLAVVPLRRSMWHSSDSLHDFLAPSTPNDTRFLFMSYAGAAEFSPAACRGSLQQPKCTSDAHMLSDGSTHVVTWWCQATVHALRDPAAAAREDMLGLAERLGRVLQGLPEELRRVRRRQLHFATSSLPALRGSSWLPRLLGSWRSPRRILHVQTTEGAAIVRTRLCRTVPTNTTA
jgi:hypothetical protein